MVTTVKKRDGSSVAYCEDKIYQAIKGAFEDLGKTFKDNKVMRHVRKAVKKMGDEATVEEIQDAVEYALMKYKYYDVAKQYIQYRYLHQLKRQSSTDAEFLALINGSSEYWNEENSNKNAKLVTVQRDYLAGIASTDIARNYIFSPDVMAAHDAGIVHQHDMDYMAQSTLHNCDLLNLEDMLQNGTVINNVKINKPHRLITAMTITTQIMAACASNQYGGLSISLAHLAPFVRDSYNLYLDKYKVNGRITADTVRMAKVDLQKEIEDAVQTFNYQISTLFTLNGQAPFSTVFMYLNEAGDYKPELIKLIREFLRQREEGMPNRQGIKVTQAFPKIIYVLQEDNYKPGTKYWYITEQAIRCSSKRLTPDYISEKVMKELKVDANGDGQCYTSMGCRSFLTPYLDKDGNPKYYGRFNGGVNSINLPDVAFFAKTENSDNPMDCFWQELDNRLEIMHKGLQTRLKRLARTRAKVAPILWMDGALARLDPDDTLEQLVYGGYMTISLGYVGLYECVKTLIGESHTTEAGMDLGKKILQHMNDKAAEWRDAENVAYSVYGSPAESIAYKFATKTRERYPELFDELFPGKKYFENSFHVSSSEEIDPFRKIDIESEYQKLSPGGMISYIESCDLTYNQEALYAIIEYIYHHIMYCEINIKTSYCQVCGNEQTIEVHKDENGLGYWECSACGNKDTEKMNVAARTCGYVGTNFWNVGKTQEIASRYISLDNHEEVI